MQHDSAVGWAAQNQLVWSRCKQCSYARQIKYTGTRSLVILSFPS